MWPHYMLSQESQNDAKRVMNVCLLLSVCSFLTVLLPKEYNYILDRQKICCQIPVCIFSILTTQVTSEGVISAGFYTYM